MWALPRRPSIDDMMIATPSLRAFHSGATIWISQWLETTLLSSVLRSASSEISLIGP